MNLELVVDLGTHTGLSAQKKNMSNMLDKVSDAPEFFNADGETGTNARETLQTVVHTNDSPVTGIRMQAPLFHDIPTRGGNG